MNSFFKSIVYSTISCFIFSSSFSQDRILTKKGDTLSVFVKKIEVLKVFYVKTNTQASETFEISKSSLHKIIWRTGKEYIIDPEFEKKALLNQERLGEAKINLGIGNKDVLNSQSQTTKKGAIILPQIVVDTLPPAPVLNRNFMLFYIEYKIDGKRVKREEFSEVLNTYDPSNYILFEEGLAMVKSSVTKRLASWVLRLGSIPLAKITPSLFVWGNYGLLTFSIIQQTKTWKGRKRIKESLNNYNYKRKSNFLRPPNAIVVPAIKK